jgi:L-seryl-tRNA(Ser) seleniumtransferase
MPRAVLKAFVDAALDAVALDELQAAASREIAAATGAEAGLVTAGAAAALTLGTAAILTRFDAARMEALPHCDGFPHTFVVAREQRNGYDHAVRLAGARFVEVGFHEPSAGSGVRRVEAWEYEAAMGPQTAGVFYVFDAHSHPPLAELVACAHAHGLPVLVDAAGELPPRSHLRDLLTAGADLVAFSGGKAIRGPQATGILCGRRDLIAAAAVQMLDLDDHFSLWEPPADFIDKSQLKGYPRHGIGRSMKVSKEQIVALLGALRLFSSGAYDAELPEMRRRLDVIGKALTGLPVACRVVEPGDGQGLPILEVTLDRSRTKRSALEVCRALRRGTPSVQMGHARLHESMLTVNPLCLVDDTPAQLARRLREELTAH